MKIMQKNHDKKEMLEAARHVPTPDSAQGNVISVVRDQALKMQLAEAAGNQMSIS